MEGARQKREAEAAVIVLRVAQDVEAGQHELALDIYVKYAVAHQDRARADAGRLEELHEEELHHVRPWRRQGHGRGHVRAGGDTLAQRGGVSQARGRQAALVGAGLQPCLEQ